MFCGRNRRSAQGDRISAITVSLQPSSESDEDSILSGMILCSINKYSNNNSVLPPPPLFLTGQFYVGVIKNKIHINVFYQRLMKGISFCPCITTGSVRYDAGEMESESGHTRLAINNPIFQLYQAVRGGRNTQGQLVAEPFLQLPSRREYPDYFQQIKHPISLQQIRY